MHERRAAEELVREAVRTVHAVGASRALRCVVQGDAMAHLDAASFTAWWQRAAQGSPVEEAELLLVRNEQHAAFGIRLASLEVE